MKMNQDEGYRPPVSQRDNAEKEEGTGGQGAGQGKKVSATADVCRELLSSNGCLPMAWHLPPSQRPLSAT